MLKRCGKQLQESSSARGHSARDHWAQALLLSLIIAWGLVGCKDTEPQSLASTREHAREILQIAQSNLQILRRELPLGAKRLGRSWSSGSALTRDPLAARRALKFARTTSQTLRQSHATFFAITHAGVVIRSDQPVDELAGVSLREAFPALTAGSGYGEAWGYLPQGSIAGSKTDRQWLAATPIATGEGKLVAQYVVGLSSGDWARQLQGRLRTLVKRRQQGSLSNLPLLYCFLVVGDAVYSGPRTPAIDVQSIADVHPVAHLSAAGSFSQILKIEGRAFALAVESFSELAPGAAVAVLRSET